MSMIKRYLENVVCRCSDQAFGQEAVEHAIITGRVKLTYKLEDDVRMIMQPAGEDRSFVHRELGLPYEKPAALYDTLIEEYQAVVQSNEAALFASHQPIRDYIAVCQREAA